MRTKTWMVLALGIVVLVLAILWNRRVYPPQEELLLGCIFDLTGSLSYMGQWSLEGAKLAEHDVNAAGGIQGKRLRLVIDDAETNPQKAVTIFQRFVSVDRFPVVIGFNASSEVMAAAPIANRSHVVLFSTGGASPLITDAGDFIFRNRLSGAVEAARMAELAYTNMGLRRGLILFINNDYGQGYSDAFRQRFTGLGGVILETEAFSQDQTDFRAQVQKVATFKGIDFVYLATYVREGAGILRQAKEAGISTRWLASNAIEGPDLFEIAQRAAEGLVFTVAQYDSDSPTSKSFNAAYKDAYGRNSEMFAANAYDAIRLLASIIQDHGYDGDRIKQALYGVSNYPGVSGMTTFDRNGDVIKPVAIKQVQNGKFQEIEASSLDTHKEAAQGESR